MTDETLEGTDPLVYLPSVCELKNRVDAMKLRLRRLEILLKAAEELQKTMPMPSSYGGEKS